MKKWVRINKALSWLSAVIIVVTVVAISVRWKSIPDSIAIAFNSIGKVSAYGSKLRVLKILFIDFWVYAIASGIGHFFASEMPDGGCQTRQDFILLLNMVKLFWAAVISYIAVCMTLIINLGAWLGKVSTAFLLWVYVILLFDGVRSMIER